MKTYLNVDEYIHKADPKHRAILEEVRSIVKSAAPKAEESIAYGMPSYKYIGQPLFYFAAMKGHLGLYPTPGPIITLADKLTEYSTSKGCVRIPYNTKLPKDIIIDLLQARKREIDML